MRPHRGNAGEKEGGKDGKGGRLYVSYHNREFWFGTYFGKHDGISACERRVRVEVLCYPFG